MADTAHSPVSTVARAVDPEADPTSPPRPTDDPVESILDLARWAPSGDNAQPWRFHRLGLNQVCVDTRDQSQDCLYERDGRCGLISIGILLETLRLAATTVGRSADIARIPGGNPRAPSFTVRFPYLPGSSADPLAAWIRQRSVHRGPYAVRPLRESEIAALQAAVGPDFELQIAGAGQRRRWASLNQRAALLRLDTREGWDLTKRIIDWDATVSTERLPDHALGIPSFLLGQVRRQLTSWSWQRTHFINRYLGGTLMPRLLLEWWPGLRCAAHLALRAVKPDDTVDGWLLAGAAVQRLWLTATSLGLQHQPGVTPLIFGRYARDGLAFSADQRALAYARTIATDLRQLLGRDALERVVWMGRIGEAPPLAARSTRLDLAALCTTTNSLSTRHA